MRTNCAYWTAHARGRTSHEFARAQIRPCCCRDRASGIPARGRHAAAIPIVHGGSANLCAMLPCRTAVSRRTVLRGLSSGACAVALGGCAELAATGTRFDASGLSLNPVLLVATTRKPVNGARAKPWFGPQRASAMTVARAKLAPPAEGKLSLAAV